MRRSYLLTVLAIAFMGMATSATGLSGAWEGSLLLGDGSAFRSTLNLEFGLADGWEFSSSWTVVGTDLRWGTLKLQGSLGSVDFAAGIGLRLEGDTRVSPAGSAFALEGVEVVGGFLSLEFHLGDLTLGITLATGSQR